MRGDSPLPCFKSICRATKSIVSQGSWSETTPLDCTKRETRATDRQDTWPIRFGLFLLCFTRGCAAPHALNVSSFACFFSFLGSHFASLSLFVLKIYPFLLTFGWASFLLFFHAQRTMCWHHKVVCGRHQSHRDVWCDFLSTFAGTCIAGHFATLLGSPLTVSLSLHWSWLSTGAS